MKNIFKNINFPAAKKYKAGSIFDDIKCMNAEQTRDAIKNIFDDFENKTGLKPIIVGNDQPTSVLFPKENIQQSNNEK